MSPVMRTTMTKLLFAFALILGCSGAQAQDRHDRYQRNFQNCMDNHLRGARVTRREMRSIREECKHIAAARTERQARSVDRDRRVYVPPPVRPLERY